MTDDTQGKGKKIGYWVATGLTAVGMLGGGIGDLIAPPEVVAIFEGLGYPLYLPALLGIAKILAAVTILAPGFVRLKEWAYAGMAIDVIGASYSHTMAGQSAMDIITPLVVLALVLTSYFLRPDNRRLPDLPTKSA